MSQTQTQFTLPPKRKLELKRPTVVELKRPGLAVPLEPIQSFKHAVEVGLAVVRGNGTQHETALGNHRRSLTGLEKGDPQNASGVRLVEDGAVGEREHETRRALSSGPFEEVELALVVSLLLVGGQEL
jgi:hypothetical protein